MATNISDDGSAPVDFNLSSTIDNSESKNEGPRKKCLLCNNLRKTFYCKICVANGDFVSSNPRNPERYADKKLLWLKLKSDKQTLSSKCLKVFEKMEVKMRLQTEINQCKGRIKLLMQLIKKKNEVIKKTSKEIETIKEKNLARVVRLPRNKDRVEKLQLFVATNMKDEIKQRRIKVAKAEMELKKVVQKNVEDLIRYIFPICKIDAISKSQEELESTDTVQKLAEATRTSYVRGKWVFMDSTGDLHYKIVAPTLPGSGDYSAYSDWVAANKNGVPGNEKMDENQAYNISAALCYTTQLVNLLAFYLDVLLPNRLSYVDFYSTDISDNKFCKRISKLNMNILYLCFSQGVDTSLLNPKHTLCNLLHLVNHPDLGRTEPFEIDSNLFLSLENYLERKTDDCLEDEENDVVPSEWEAIPLVPCPENVPGSTAFSMQQMPSMQATTTSMANGLVTSLASMWRGWTGNRRLIFFQSTDERKSQEENYKKLQDSQNNVFQKLSEVLSQSSCSTYLEDFEPTARETNTTNNEVPSQGPSSPYFNSYLLRNRNIQKSSIEMTDFGLSQQPKRRRLEINKTTIESFSQMPREIENSQESVSMLQGYNEDKFPELIETCMNSQLEMININSNEEPDNCGQKFVGRNPGTSAETQTDFSIFENNGPAKKDIVAVKHAKFLGCVIKLRVIISSKGDVSKESLSSILKSTPGEEMSSPDTSEDEEIISYNKIVSKETIGYLLRSADTEDVFLKTVQALLIYLENEINDDLDKVVCCWKNSVYEMAVNMINKAVDIEPEIRKNVDFFLYRLIGSILKNEEELKNLGLESKAMFLLNFCQSIHLNYVAIDYIISKLKYLKFIRHGGETSWTERVSWMRLAKTTYYLLRVLEDLLKSFKTKIRGKEIDHVLEKKSEVKNYNVLEMWKKRWRDEEGDRETQNKEDGQHHYKLEVSKWCDVLDDVLVHCVKHVVVSSMAVERCGKLAKEVLNMCHPKIVLTKATSNN